MAAAEYIVAAVGGPYLELAAQDMCCVKGDRWDSSHCSFAVEVVPTGIVVAVVGEAYNNHMLVLVFLLVAEDAHVSHDGRPYL